MECGVACEVRGLRSAPHSAADLPSPFFQIIPHNAVKILLIPPFCWAILARILKVSSFPNSRYV